MTRKEEKPAVRPTPVLEEAPDPLREGQRRCQQMGEAAARDSECLRIWAETRDRFLGTRTAPRRADEQVMVEDSGHFRETSRLACQVPYDDDLDGIQVTLAPEF